VLGTYETGAVGKAVGGESGAVPVQMVLRLGSRLAEENKKNAPASNVPRRTARWLVILIECASLTVCAADVFENGAKRGGTLECVAGA
jgi:hypothetical protein